MLPNLIERKWSWKRSSDSMRPRLAWMVLRADTNFRSPRDILEHLNKLLTLERPIAAGFKKSMVAVVSFRGCESSALSAFDQLGTYRLRNFTGRYDLLGSPFCTGGSA